MLQPYFFVKVLATRCCTQWDDQMICKPILNETNKPQAWISYVDCVFSWRFFLLMPQKTSGISPCRRCLSRPFSKLKSPWKTFETRWPKGWSKQATHLLEIHRGVFFPPFWRCFGESCTDFLIVVSGEFVSQDFSKLWAQLSFHIFV